MKSIELLTLKEQLQMVKGIICSADRAVFSGIDSNPIDWLAQSHSYKTGGMDKELTDAVESLKKNIRAALVAQKCLADIVENRLNKQPN